MAKVQTATEYWNARKQKHDDQLDKLQLQYNRINQCFCQRVLNSRLITLIRSFITCKN